MYKIVMKFGNIPIHVTTMITVRNPKFPISKQNSNFALQLDTSQLRTDLFASFIPKCISG